MKKENKELVEWILEYKTVLIPPEDKLQGLLDAMVEIIIDLAYE